MEKQPLIHDRYRLVRPLSRGGQGTAYLAEDSADGAQVVVKLLRMADVRGWAQVELFERESRVLQGLDHDSIPRYIDSFEAEVDGQHTFVLVQEYAAAPCLEQLIASGWHATEEQIRETGSRLLSIVAYLHSLRPPIVHRDINTRNVLRGDDRRVYLVDFGGVQDVLRLQSSQGTTLIGTPGFAPPEQVLGRATERSDLYAVAVTLVVLLTHRDPTDLPVREMKVDFGSLVEVSPHLAAVLDSYLEPDESRRTLAVTRAIALLDGTAAPEPGADGRLEQEAPRAGDRPYGSRIRVYERRGSRLLVVPQGARAASLPLGGFSIFWLGFVAFWTFSAVAMGAPIIFPLFSIPFWCVGLYLLYRTLNGVFGRTEVELAAGELTVDRRLFWLSRRMTVPLAEVGPCRIAAAAAAAGSGQAQGPPQTACLLDAGAVRVSLAGSLSDREKEWLRDTINAHLDAHRPRR